MTLSLAFFFTVPSTTNKKGGSGIRLIQLFILFWALSTFYIRLFYFFTGNINGIQFDGLIKAHSDQSHDWHQNLSMSSLLATVMLARLYSSPAALIAAETHPPLFIHPTRTRPRAIVYRVTTHRSSIFHSQNYRLSHAIC